MRLCDRLEAQDLAEVLKWPFAMGEAETIVLASLEKKTRQQFAGDVWKFVEQADPWASKTSSFQRNAHGSKTRLKNYPSYADGTAHR